MRRKFLAIGECMVELAEVDAGLYRRGFAGDTFNAAWYARTALGEDWTVGFASCVGTDALSDEMVAFCMSQGIDTSDLRRIAGATVGLYMIALQNGERSFSYWRDTSAARRLADDADALDRAMSTATHIHLSGITAAILSPDGRRTLSAALDRAREHGVSVSFDTNIRPRLWKSADAMRAGLESFARSADIVLPSFDEEADVFGDTTPLVTIDRYRSLGVGTVVVKNGADPVEAWWRDEGFASVPVVAARVVDTTAAGDSFAGTFLAARLKGRALVDAIKDAADVSARVIGARGALVDLQSGGVDPDASS